MKHSTSSLASRLALISAFSLAVSGAALAAPRRSTQVELGEDFKGEPPATQLTIGGMGGLGIIDGQAGFAVIGDAAYKIVPKGFAPDINNLVFVEAELGPVLVNGGNAFTYSFHLRWDFPKDDKLTLYGLGGFAGHILDSKLGSRSEAFPRFGAGIFYVVNPAVGLRVELSHELTTAGVSFGF